VKIKTFEEGESVKSAYRIAKEIGVSPQAVYKKLKTVQVDGSVERSKNGGYMLDCEAEKSLRDMFTSIQPGSIDGLTVGQPELNSSPTAVQYPPVLLDNEFEDLKRRLERLEAAADDERGRYNEHIRALEDDLRAEREHNRLQSDKIAELAAMLAELNRNSQLLIAAKSGGWLSRLRRLFGK
jgi:predicted Rossmann fold nucleotide-binding protein DprA/Smf involved in DNA uptake